METAFARIAVAAKNADTREHDIADSDDYFQYHGGMVAMVRVTDRPQPGRLHRRLGHADAVKDAHAGRGDTPGVPVPGWRTRGDRGHVLDGYKGAFELAATVDYLFGYDATTHVVADWMYERLAAAYVFDPENLSLYGKSIPGLCAVSRSASWRRFSVACGGAGSRRRWISSSSRSSSIWRATWRPKAERNCGWRTRG